MTKRSTNKIRRGLAEALAVAKGGPSAIMLIKVTPSCGCVFCDVAVALYRDDHGYYHDGPEGVRIACEAVIHD